MRNLTIIALKSIIALALAGSLVVLDIIALTVWQDLSNNGMPQWQQVAFIAIPVASVITMQVFGVCVWRLLTLVRKGAVFSKAAFGLVNVLIGTFVTASLLVVVMRHLLTQAIEYQSEARTLRSELDEVI